jgi:hypothetical protein
LSLAYSDLTAPVTGKQASCEAVFIHSGWRSAGTWVWNEFRTHAQVMAFYEPLHEALGGVTLESLPQISVDSWNSRHSLSRPYFEEFAPLLGRGRRGVAGYDRSFAFDRFFSAPNEPAHKLFAYLSRLLLLAHGSGKIPVLKFCRSLGRVAWMRSHFPQALHLGVLRDPLAQWISAYRLAESGNRYFLAAPLAILVQHQRDARVATALSTLELRLSSLRQNAFEKTYGECDGFVVSATLQALYRSFVAFWLVTACTSLPYVDETIDSDVIGASPLYRQQLQDNLMEKTGIDVDLGAARIVPAGRQDCELRSINVESVHADASRALDLLLREADWPNPGTTAAAIRRKLEEPRS